MKLRSEKKTVRFDPVPIVHVRHGPVTRAVQRVLRPSEPAQPTISHSATSPPTQALLGQPVRFF